MLLDIAPGSILQRMYLKRRLKKTGAETFCEIGGGNGYTAKILLSSGLKGIGYDLNSSACDKNMEMNRIFINKGIYEVRNSDFFKNPGNEKYDIIISCMVIEHFLPEMLENYFKICRSHLTENGRLIIMVPSSMRYWGIEDEIAGHFKRYEFDDFHQIASRWHLRIIDLAGLTYPLSNWLFSLSNRLVKKNEGYKAGLEMEEQTILSGNRENKFKSSFPPFFKIILNETVLFPFYILQIINRRNPKSMIIYCEMSK